MPSPRKQAEKYNSPAGFDPSVEDYDAVAGTPPGVAPQRPPRDYAADPKNPVDKPAPAKNLKR